MKKVWCNLLFVFQSELYWLNSKMAQCKTDVTAQSAVQILMLCNIIIDSISLSTWTLKCMEILEVPRGPWLRRCATNRKVAGSIPAGVSGFFIDIKSFRSRYGLGVDSASNRNEYQEYFLGVKAAGAWGWQPYHHPVPLSRNLGTLTSWNPLGLSRPVMGLIYWKYFRNYKIHPNVLQE